MGFYAGAINNKKILSLNTKVGGDRNQHEFPDDATIFHSSMPHIFGDVYEVPLTKLTKGFTAEVGNLPNVQPYYVGNLPSTIQNLINTNPGRVILVEVFYTIDGKEYSKLVQGTRFRNFTMQTINDARGDYVNENFTSYTWMSRDINFRFGYYNPTYKADCPEAINIGMSMAGDRQLMAGSAFHQTVGYGKVNHCFQMYSFSNGGFADDAWRVPGSGGGIQAWIRDQFNLRLNANNTNSTKFYVSCDFCPAPIGGGPPGDDPSWQVPSIKPFYEFCTMDSNGANSNYLFSCSLSSMSCSSNPSLFGTVSVYDYNVIPTKVRFIVTNLQYSNSSFSILSNPFDVSKEIRLQGGNFIVGGVNLSTMSQVMFNQVTSAPILRPDLSMTTSNQSIGGFTGLSTYSGDFPLMGSSNVNGSSRRNINVRRRGSNPSTTAFQPQTDTYRSITTDGTPSDVKNHQLSYYNFKQNNGWYVDTKSNAIGNNNGSIWEPNKKPLKLFAGNTATVTIGNTYPSTSNAGVHTLNTMNLGLDTSSVSTIIVSIQMLDSRFQFPMNSPHFSSYSDRYGAPATPSYIRVEKLVPNDGNNFKIELLQLEVDRFVPFWFGEMVKETCAIISGGNYYYVNGNASITIGMVKRSSGAVEVIAIVRHNYDPNRLPGGYIQSDLYVYMPYMRITAQRLT